MENKNRPLKRFKKEAQEPKNETTPFSSFDVRSPMVVSTERRFLPSRNINETLTGGIPHFGVTGHNASSPNNKGLGFHQRATAIKPTPTLPDSPGHQLKTSMMKAYNDFGDVRSSIGHAEGDVVFKAQQRMMNMGIQHSEDIIQGRKSGFSPDDLAKIPEASGTNDLRAYAKFESSALAWNDVSQHGEIIGPESVPAQAHRYSSPAGRNPKAWVEDFDSDGKVRLKTTWSTCKNCQTQIMPHLRKHNR